MLLTIHNLPSSTRYIDVKSLLQEKCGLTELILDNLLAEGNTKRVTVGLADEGDAAILVRKINGLYINGQQLYVEDKRKKKDSDQPYRSSASLVQEYQEAVAPQKQMGDMAAMNNAMMMNYNMAGLYMQMPMVPIDQSVSYMGYGGYMGMPAAEPRPPGPADGRGGFPGDGGPAGGRGGFPGDGGPAGRPREPARAAPRANARKRRASPDRPAENFDRPSRWNAPDDGPPRRDKSPPRQAWQPRDAARGPRPPPPERARDLDQFQPRADPDWRPQAPRWEDERRPPRAQPEPQWEPPTPRWEPKPERAWQPEPEPAWRPEPEPAWQPEPERTWQPEPERAWQPEPEAAWNEAPPRTMENNDRQFDNWEGNFPPEADGNRPGPERFEPNDRRFNEGHPPAPHGPDFHRRPREHADDRGRRPRREDDWNAGNDRGGKDVASQPGRGEQPWQRRDEPHRPSRPSRPANREARPPGAGRREWRDEPRPPPAKRPAPERQRGPADWNQVASDYPAKRPRENIDKRAPEPRRDDFPPRPPKPRQEPIQKPPARRGPVTQSNISEHKPKKITQIINKDQTSRGQATANLYKQILSRADHSQLIGAKLLPGIVKELKACIRSRIDVMLGEQLMSRFEEIIGRYRRKYSIKDDMALFDCMKDKVSQQLEQEEMGKETGKVIVKTEKTEKNEKTETANKNGNKPKVEKEKPSREDMTDKQIIREEKQARKVEFSKADYYKMDPVTENIVAEELAKITEIFESECADPANDMEKQICNRITTQSAKEFVQTARLHVAKRALDIHTGLAVRIFADGKLPRRTAVKEYLKRYRIDRLVLKKNKRGSMFVANVGSFEQYDHLCQLQHDVIDGSPVTIRSMYLVGPVPKPSKSQMKQRRKQFISSQVEPRTDYIIPPDTETDEKSQAEVNKIEPAGEEIKAEDAMGDLNAETMEDFTTDDLDGTDFAAEDYSADNFEEDPEDDPEGLNIGDIKEEDLEDF